MQSVEEMKNFVLNSPFENRISDARKEIELEYQSLLTQQEYARKMFEQTINQERAELGIENVFYYKRTNGSLPKRKLSVSARRIVKRKYF